MRAVVFDKPGGPEVLRVAELPNPEPGAGEALIAVKTAGVNRADLLQRAGKYPPPEGASPILGLEVAGEVLHGGDSFFAIRDRVMAVVTGGGYGNRAVVPSGMLLPVPRGMSWPEAAAIPEAFLTAWMNLVELGRLEEGETVLIHAGASGVGTAAIQLARELGARVITTAGTDAKLEVCRRLGADRAIHRVEEDFGEVVMQVTGGAGCDLVVDCVGAPYVDRDLQVLRRNGRLVLVGFLGGSRGDVDLGPVLRKSLTVTGTTLRGTPLKDKVRINREFWEFAGPRFATKALRPLVDRCFSIDAVAAAHQRMAENLNTGKLVLLTDRAI